VPCAGSGRGEDGDRCETCHGTGFKGRVGVYEIMSMTDELRRLTAQKADSATLYAAARRSGFRSMREDAVEKLAAGITTEAEISRVLR
ncbi:MAG: hypothetical protein IH985_09775, partial [Planctomycetes bacterium]|nr:hypothetical protein [Planctomycetota bacterium]